MPQVPINQINDTLAELGRIEEELSAKLKLSDEKKTQLDVHKGKMT